MDTNDIMNHNTNEFKFYYDIGIIKNSQCSNNSNSNDCFNIVACYNDNLWFISRALDYNLDNIQKKYSSILYSPVGQTLLLQSGIVHTHEYKKSVHSMVMEYPITLPIIAHEDLDSEMIMNALDRHPMLLATIPKEMLEKEYFLKALEVLDYDPFLEYLSNHMNIEKYITDPSLIRRINRIKVLGADHGEI